METNNSENVNANGGSRSLHAGVGQKLWRVCLRGSLQRYSPSYVVAPDATSAYQAIRDELDKKDYGFAKDRELQTVELLAEDYEYTETGTRLFLPNVEPSCRADTGSPK